MDAPIDAATQFEEIYREVFARWKYHQHQADRGRSLTAGADIAIAICAVCGVVASLWRFPGRFVLIAIAILGCVVASVRGWHNPSEVLAYHLRLSIDCGRWHRTLHAISREARFAEVFTPNQMAVALFVRDQLAEDPVEEDQIYDPALLAAVREQVQ